MLAKRFVLFLTLFATFAIVDCTYKPPDDPNARPGTGFNLFPVWYDNMLGHQYASIYRHELPVLENAPVQNGVRDLGMHLVHAYYGEEKPPFDFEFYVVNLDVMNAFALPGGKIFVFRGLLEDIETEAELAGVLAHEMGHAVARHGTKNLSKGIAFQSILLTGTAILSEKKRNLAAVTYIGGSIALSLSMLKFSRDHEREADWIAVHNVYRAGYDPEGMITLFDRFKNQKGETDRRAGLFLSSHPTPDERQKNVTREFPKLALNRQWNENQYGCS